jgi:lipopolysaccharide/colanic/teichoic acid biosynthesis glycosyltransferase
VRSLLLKRVLDVTGAVAAFTLGAPVFAGVAAVVWYDVGRPILFRQRRPGLHGQPFEFVKFRTMRAGAGTDAERLTRIGRWLRATSLDELPELWNVLRGEMSLVGPRPLLMKYLDRYSADHARRHDVKPGLTGWAQINGRNAPDWDTKLDFDTWYVDHWSNRLDLEILVRTVGAVLRRDGIRHGGDATMPELPEAMSQPIRR